jgi:hypothetical protein
MLRTIAIATLLAGTLDLLSAFVFQGAVVSVLQSVASGPFGGEIAGGSAGAVLGVVTHFTIMTVMVAAYMLAARSIPALNRNWLIAGLLYGFALWIVMYWIVLPLRFESYQTPSEAWPIAKQLFSHLILVGLPIAWVAARRVRAG